MKNCILLLLGFVMSVYLVEPLGQWTYDLVQYQACGVVGVPLYSGVVRTSVDCVITCRQLDQGSNLCYDSLTRECTCCSPSIFDSLRPPVSKTSKCYRIVSCPAGLTLVGSWCYRVHVAAVDFNTCQSICSSGGYKMLKLETHEIRTAFEEVLKSNPGPTNYYWLGIINNSTAEGDKRLWYDVDTGAVVTVTNWGSADPNGHETVSPEYCVAALWPVNLDFVDLACERLQSCICQM